MNKHDIDGLASAAQAVAFGFKQGLKQPPPPDFLEWAKSNVVFGKDDPIPGPYQEELFPFFTEILRKLQPDDPARTVTLMKSAQIGGTVVAMIFTAASLDLDPGKFLYVHPTLDNGRRWDDTKWQPFLDTMKLRAQFPTLRSRNAKNRSFYKERLDGRGSLLISGANSPSSLSMVSYRRQVQDDMAKWENNAAGDPESQADSRSSAYEYDAKILKVSTPLIKGDCRITEAYERSDKRKLEVPCPHCDFFHILEWENFARSLHDDMDPSKAHFTCPDCGGVIEHHHKPEMLQRAVWRATQTDRPRDPGYWIWQAYSMLRSWASIAEKWLESKHSPEKEQTFYNDVLGLPYEQKGESPPWEEIRARSQNSEYHVGVIPPNALLLTLTVDVQGDRVEWLLKGFGPNQQRFTIQHDIIEGHITEERTRKALDFLVRRKWKNFLGNELEPDIVGIDMGYETNEVKSWARRWPENKVICLKGHGSNHHPPLAMIQEKDETGRRLKKSKRFWWVGVSGIKASLYKHLEKEDTHAFGYCGYPHDLPDEYYIQLCAERRVKVTKSDGSTELRWKKLKDVRNEILDLEVYAEACARRLNWTTAPESEWERLRAEREKAPANQQLDLMDVAMPIKAAHSELTSTEETDSTPPPSKPVRKRRVRNKGV